MKERNKSIFRILLFASVGILLAQTVLLAVLGDDAFSRIGLPSIFIVAELTMGGLFVFCTLNPQFNYNYTVKKVDGRWRWKRIEYGPDPEGLRYVSAGVSVLAIAIIFAVMSARIIRPALVTDNMVTIAVVVLLAIYCVTYCIIENKLRKQQ